MSITYTAEAVGNALKKTYERGVNPQFYDDNWLLKRVEKGHSSDIKGSTVTFGLHAGRLPNAGPAANGAVYGTPGKQGVYQSTIPLMYNYAPTMISGPDMEASKRDPGAFADLLTLNQDGAMADMKRDISRQVNADGSGIICFASSTDTSGSIPALPYLWADPTAYLPAGRELQIYDVVQGSTSNLDTNTRAGAAVVSSVTVSGGVMSAVVCSDVINTSGAGDVIGNYGSLQLANGTSFTQYEVMGIAGLVHNTDLIGSTAWKYDAGDAGNTAVTNFTGPEGQAYDWAGPTSSSNTNTVQGLATASYSWWKSVVWGNGGVPRALTFELLDSMIDKMRVERGSKLTAIYTTANVRRKLKALLRADRRYSDKMTIDGGIKVDSYDDIPIFVSNDNARGVMYFLDESEFVWYDAKGYFYLTGDSGNVLHKASQQDVYEITAATYTNLGCRSRWRQGKIIDILET